MEARPAPQTTDYLTLTETALRLKMGLSSVLHRIYTGQIEATRNESGKGWRISRASVEAFEHATKAIAAARAGSSQLRVSRPTKGDRNSGTGNGN